MEKFAWVLAVIVLFAGKSIAQPSYLMNLTNGEFIDSKTIEFDVTIKSNNESSFFITSYQCALVFNDSLIGSGEISFEYITNSSELNNLPQNSIGTQFFDGQNKLHFASSPGTDTISAYEKRIGRFRFKNSDIFPSARPNIMWCFTGNVQTILTGSNFSNITDTLNFSSSIFQVPVPVELLTFSAEASGNDVNLFWKTATETNNRGFSVQKRRNNSSFKEISFVIGKGNSTELCEYSFSDTDAEAGKTFYRLVQIDYDGTATYYDEIEISLAPQEFNLSQNYPNPFNPSTKINFTLPYDSNVNIEVFNMLGELIDVLHNGVISGGFYEKTWNGENFASGIYVVRISAKSLDGNFSLMDSKKMQLLK